jgi:hypothetical protein
MMVKSAAEIIQAFPITPHTYVGTPNAIDARPYDILHAAADGDITFDFGAAGTVTVSVANGQDLAIHSDTIAITATGQVWMS